MLPEADFVLFFADAFLTLFFLAALPALLRPEAAFLAAGFRDDLVAAFFRVPELPVAVDFLVDAFLVPRFVEDDLAAVPEPDFLPEEAAAFELFFGALAPSALASDKPMAMACLREVTFFPEPVLSFPSCISCITFSTFSPERFEYFAIHHFFKLSEIFIPSTKIV